jgi:hypothetical protein
MLRCNQVMTSSVATEFTVSGTCGEVLCKLSLESCLATPVAPHTEKVVLCICTHETITFGAATVRGLVPGVHVSSCCCCEP